jgi:propionyl-CoA carboxylase beta chain
MASKQQPKQTKSKLEGLRERSVQAEQGGGTVRVEKQHAAGKMTARERVEFLLDEGSFEEFDKLVVHRSKDFGLDKQLYPGDGVVTGHGLIEGRNVFVFAQDFTIFGGSLSETHAEKICKVMDLAMKVGAPIIGLNDSGGARIQEGVVSLGGYADIFLRNTLASGVVPQISCIMGPCAGGAVYSPAITDFNIMVKDTSYMFITGPDVIKTVTHEEVTKESWEEPSHTTVFPASRISPLTQTSMRCESCASCFSFIPSKQSEDPPRLERAIRSIELIAKLNEIVPEASNQPYDIRDVINSVVDDGYFFEVQQMFAPNICVGFARLGAKSVGSSQTSRRFSRAFWIFAASVKGAPSFGSATASIFR